MLSCARPLASAGLLAAAALSALLLPAAPARAQEADTCIANVTFDRKVSESYGRAENRATWGAESGGAVNIHNARWTFGAATIDLFVEVALQSERRCLSDLALRVTRRDGFAEAPRGYHYVGHWAADGGGAQVGDVFRRSATVWLYARRAGKGAARVLGDVALWASSDDADALRRRTQGMVSDGWRLQGMWDAYEVALGSAADLRGVASCGEDERAWAENGCAGHWTAGLLTRQVVNAAGRDPSEIASALGGRWVKKGECASCGQLVQTYSIGVTDETAVEKTTEVSRMIGGSVTVTGGGGLFEAAVEASREYTASQVESVVAGLQQSEGEEIEYTCPRGALWQWVTQVQWADGRATQAKTSLMTCTVAGDAPEDPTDISWQGCDAEQVAAELADTGKTPRSDRLAVKVGVDAGWRCKTGG